MAREKTADGSSDRSAGADGAVGAERSAPRAGTVRRLVRAVRELPGTWRGSLQLRVVSGTMLLSIVVAAALGWVLNTQIRDGLIKAKESSSLSLVSSNLGQATS